MDIVEGQVEVENVPGQIGPQRVGGRPGDVLAGVGGSNRHNSLDQDTGNKEQGDQDERLLRRAGLNAIKKVTNNLRAEQLQADAAQQQGRQPKDSQLLRLQIGKQ
jgi:hypothetical protein